MHSNKLYLICLSYFILKKIFYLHEIQSFLELNFLPSFIQCTIFKPARILNSFLSLFVIECCHGVKTVVALYKRNKFGLGFNANSRQAPIRVHLATASSLYAAETTREKFYSGCIVARRVQATHSSIRFILATVAKTSRHETYKYIQRWVSSRVRRRNKVVSRGMASERLWRLRCARATLKGWMGKGVRGGP